MKKTKNKTVESLRPLDFATGMCLAYRDRTVLEKLLRHLQGLLYYAVCGFLQSVHRSASLCLHYPSPFSLLLLHRAAPSAQRLERLGLKHVAAGRLLLLLPLPFYWEEVGGREQMLDSASKCHCTALPILHAFAPRCCAVLALCVACSALALIQGCCFL